MGDSANPLQELADDGLGHLPITTHTGIAVIALKMAVQYHAGTVITDGALYQQYKLEGKNIRELGLEDVFETAMKIEAHLLCANERIAGMVIDAVIHAVTADDENETAETSPKETP